MNDHEEYLVTEIQKIIERDKDPYLTALHIVRQILIPAMEQVREEFRMLDLLEPTKPPN